MKFITIGINYISAEVDFREKLAIGGDEQEQALKSFYKEFNTQCVILSTCNRVEIYSFGDIDTDRVSKWLSKQSGVNLYELCKHSYILQNKQVVEHLFRVVCGLDSMVLGENEILGQVKKAYRYSNENGHTNKQLNKLFQYSFNLAKQARTETEIGKNSISVMSTTLILIKQFFKNLTDKKVILVGSGKMIQIGACYLAKEKPKKLIISNRRITKIKDLAKNSNALAINLEDIDQYLTQADILITSTATVGFLISSKQLLNNLKQKNSQLLAVDLSVPRDIEITDEVQNHANFTSYTVDDLRQVIQDNLDIRIESAQQIELFIESKVEEFNRWFESQNIENTLCQVRNRQQKISYELVQKAKKEILSGKNINEIIEKLAYQITQKTLHQPLKNAKELVDSTSNEEKITLIRQIFE